MAAILVTALFAVPVLPTAQACRISLHDPTSPGISESCKDPENWIEDQGIDLDASAGGQGVQEVPVIAVCAVNETVCEPLVEASVSADTHPDRGERLTVNATLSERTPLVADRGEQTTVEASFAEPGPLLTDCEEERHWNAGEDRARASVHLHATVEEPYATWLC